MDEIIESIALFKVSPLSNAGRVSVMKHVYVLACTAAQLATLTLKAGSDLAPVQKEKSCWHSVYYKEYAVNTKATNVCMYVQH